MTEAKPPAKTLADLKPKSPTSRRSSRSEQTTTFLVAGDLNLYSYSDGIIWGRRGMTVFERLPCHTTPA